MGRIIWGIILIGIGAFYLSRNNGWTDIDIGQFIAKYWPAIFIILGLQVLAGSFKSVLLKILIIFVIIAVFVLPLLFDAGLKSVS